MVDCRDCGERFANVRARLLLAPVILREVGRHDKVPISRRDRRKRLVCPVGRVSCVVAHHVRRQYGINRKVFIDGGDRRERIVYRLRRVLVVHLHNERTRRAYNKLVEPSRDTLQSVHGKGLVSPENRLARYSPINALRRRFVRLQRLFVAVRRLGENDRLTVAPSDKEETLAGRRRTIVASPHDAPIDGVPELFELIDERAESLPRLFLYRLPVFNRAPRHKLLDVLQDDDAGADGCRPPHRNPRKPSYFL